MTKEVKSHMIVPDVVTQIANLLQIVLLEMQNATSARKLATLPMFVSRKKGRKREVEVVHRLQVPFEVDLFESQVQHPKVALHRVGCDPKKHTTVKGGHLITNSKFPKTSLDWSADLYHFHGTQ